MSGSFAQPGAEKDEEPRGEAPAATSPDLRRVQEAIEDRREDTPRRHPQD
ncbi:MAG: hypothetical protein JWO26_1691 [Rhodospirillales bacterium]|jgi:hypothetical protein|nr:hypothetical protein [Rhodospirillales bacterium]MDB5382059.1 hypothetical protein [Rhodospirillales bacterium]